MKKEILFIAALFLAASVVDAQRKVVCYWFTEASINNVNPNICTHIIYSFMGLDAAGNLNHLWRSESQGLQYIQQAVALKKRNPNLKVLVAIGGYNPDLITPWYRMAENSDNRNNFARNILNLVRSQNLDGIDIDWEYPNHYGDRYQDKQNFVLLLRTLKQYLGNYLLSVAIGAGQWRSNQAYDIPAIFQTCDFVNLMSYDLHGSWESRTGIHSALYQGINDPGVSNVDASVAFILGHGVSREKLIVGIPAYGVAFNLNNVNNNGVGASAVGAGTQQYYTICQNVNRGIYSERWEPQQMNPYAVNGNSWIGYDNIRSVEIKARYINQHSLGGAMFWSIDGDDPRNVCGAGSHPLISAVYRIVHG